MYCPSCRRELPDDAAFCFSCGVRIEEVALARHADAGATLAGVGDPFEEPPVLSESFDSARGDTFLGAGGGGYQHPLTGDYRQPTPLAANPAGGLRGYEPGHLRASITPVPPSRLDDGSWSASGVESSGLDGRYDGEVHPPRVRSLREVRDSILEDRKRASDSFAAASAVRAPWDDDEYESAGLGEDSFETELVRRRHQQRRNVVLVSAAGAVGLGLALVGFVIGRVSSDDSMPAAESEAGETDGDEASPETTVPLVMAPVGDVPKEPARTAAPATAAVPEVRAAAGRAGDRVSAKGRRPGRKDLRPPPDEYAVAPAGGVGPSGAGSGAEVVHHGGGSSGGGSSGTTPTGTGPSGTGPKDPFAGASSGGTGPSATSAPATSDPSLDSIYGSGPAGHDPAPRDTWIDEAGVAMVVKHHLPKVKACFHRRAKVTPSLSGRVEVQFRIGKEGTVSKAFVLRETTGDPLVGQCIVAELEEWRFPRPVSGPVDLVYPFVFATKK